MIHLQLSKNQISSLEIVIWSPLAVNTVTNNVDMTLVRVKEK